MTNWALNRFRFTSGACDVTSFLVTALGPEKRGRREVLNFEALVPRPESLTRAPRDRHGDFVNALDEKAARDWSYAHWGCQCAFEEFAIVRRQPTCVEICFATPYTAPSGIWRAIAGRFPLASIWACAYERGHGYGYRFEAENGAVHERECSIDDKLLRDVEGESYPRRYLSIKTLIEQHPEAVRTFATVKDFVEYMTRKGAPDA